MNTKILLTILLSIASITCASAQNKIVKQKLQVTSFSAISASGGWDIIVRQGDHQSLSIEVSEEIRERAIIEVRNGTLHIYNKKSDRGFSLRNLRNSNNTVQKAYITVTDLKKLEASGGVDIYFDTPIKTDDFEVVLSGGTDLEKLTLNCQRFTGEFSGGCDAEITFASAQEIKANMSGGCDVELYGISAHTTQITTSGGSDVTLKGKTDTLIANASGGCDLSASDLIVRNANVGFSGGADGSIHVTNLLDITVSGSADVICYGNPREVNKQISKSGSLKLK